MKRLILMRHAKSDWSQSTKGDISRPLNARGRQAAAALGEWLRREGYLPDEILCSPAQRTRETCERLGLASEIGAKYPEVLYLAGTEVMLKSLNRCLGSSVLMIGHNPGIGAMAESLMLDLPVHPQFLQYPTGATLVADFDIKEWSEAAWGKAIARNFVVPRDL